MAVTKTDVGATTWQIDDDVVRLREWGTGRVHSLSAATGPWTIGSAETCELVLDDPRVSRQHARVSRQGRRWMVLDLGSKNGLHLDGARRSEIVLEPGAEIGLGGLTLIAESARLLALRSLLARLLGWGADRIETIDLALRAVRRTAQRRAMLMLCGQGDLVPIAQGLHRHVLGDARPFVVYDPRRRSVTATARSAANVPRGVAAVATALGGTLCVRRERLPRDFTEIIHAVRVPSTRTQLLVCAPHPDSVMSTTSITVPPIAERVHELGRIIDEYAADAREALAAPASFTSHDADWVLRHSASSFDEIEKGTQRLVALRRCGTVQGAAELLGISHVALSRWLGRRRVPAANLGIGSRQSGAPRGDPRRRTPDHSPPEILLLSYPDR